ncbi:MAG: BrnT family toxin [bacterium]
MKFEWDTEKAEINERKHKITFLESCYVFSDQYLLTMFDIGHSEYEDRWITMGQIPNGKILVVNYVYRKRNEEEFIRIISSRKAAKSEVKQYVTRREGKINAERI